MKKTIEDIIPILQYLYHMSLISNLYINPKPKP